MTDELHEWAAAYVLGALDPEDRAAFEAHLPECEGCRAEVADLAPIPGLLARTSPPSPGRGAEDDSLQLALTRVASERRRLQRARRWWQAVALGSVAAVLVLTLALVLPDDGVEDAPAGERVALAVTSSSATAEIDLLPRAWGSVVDIHVIEVAERPEAESFTAWVVAGDGAWEPACTWGLSDDGWARVQGASSIEVADVAEVVIAPTGDRSSPVVRAVPLVG